MSVVPNISWSEEINTEGGRPLTIADGMHIEIVSLTGGVKAA